MGVSGSGKTTVARELARAVNGVFYDADDYHSADSIAKMRRGEPLTEDDRAAWLGRLAAIVARHASGDELAVLAASALTGTSRAPLGVGRPGARLVFLHGPTELIEARMRSRRHFMPAELLPSQLALLEPPSDALELDIRQPVADLVRQIRVAFGL